MRVAVQKDAALAATATCVLCRQPVGGATCLEAFLPGARDAAAWEDALGSPVDVGRTPMTLRDVAPGSVPGEAAGTAPMHGLWLRGDALRDGRDLQLNNEAANTQLLLHQRKAGESPEDFCGRVFAGNLLLGGKSGLETPHALGPGGTLQRLPGTSLQGLLDHLFAQLATGTPELCGWTAGPWTPYLRGLWRAELPGTYAAGRADALRTLKAPATRLHPLIPRHPWQAFRSRGIPPEGAFGPDEAGQLLENYTVCAENQFAAGGGALLARLPGEWRQGSIALPVVETVLLLHLGGVHDEWLADHHLLSGRFPETRPAALLRPLRARFSGWAEACPEGGTLVRFEPVNGAAPWAMGAPTANTAEAQGGEMLLAVIRTPGMETPAGGQKPAGLYLSPTPGDLFDIEVQGATWPRAVGGCMAKVEAWPPGSAVVNAHSVALMTKPDQEIAQAELAVAADKVSVATQVTITKESSAFTKVVKIKPHMEVES